MDGIEKFHKFLAQHQRQLESSAIPQHLWRSLYEKVSTEIFDAGEVFRLLRIEYDDENDPESDTYEGNSNKTSAAPGDSCPTNVEALPALALVVDCETGVKAADPTAIYLIDHAWTFRTNTARQYLEQHVPLRGRMCTITGVNEDDEQCIDKLLRRMWRYCHFYTIDNNDLPTEERMPIWYVMDEVGSAVNHSDNPNFRVVPFVYVPTRITYALLFPICDCKAGDHVVRDFAEYTTQEAPERKALLLPWRWTDLRDEDITQTEPSIEYFLSGHIPETYAIGELCEPIVDRNRPLRVYAEYDVVREYLTAPAFELTENEDDADVLWLTHHYKMFEQLTNETPNRFVNQFPYEYIITIKDLLSVTCRRAAVEHHNALTLETLPQWLPTTYNLKTELLQFASYYQRRNAQGLDNHWIVKPWNLARSIDTHITNSLVRLMRLPVTGPKIAQKYIERPVLFHREDIDAKVKFDIRYVILLKSIVPLKAYVHRTFYLRFANHAFSLDNFDDYEKHFTVMNYQADAELHHIKCAAFLLLWQQQYPEYNWQTVEEEICVMLYEMLDCATKRPPPCGIAPCPQSRSLYAADIMLAWEQSSTVGDCKQRMQPKLLEVNWTPDCKRACDYDPEFFNDVFKLLFLNECNDDIFRPLLAPA